MQIESKGKRPKELNPAQTQIYNINGTVIKVEPKFRETGKTHTDPYYWAKSTVQKILPCRNIAVMLSILKHIRFPIKTKKDIKVIPKI